MIFEADISHREVFHDIFLCKHWHHFSSRRAVPYIISISRYRAEDRASVRILREIVRNERSYLPNTSFFFSPPFFFLFLFVYFLLKNARMMVSLIQIRPRFFRSLLSKYLNFYHDLFYHLTTLILWGYS